VPDVKALDLYGTGGNSVLMTSMISVGCGGGLVGCSVGGGGGCGVLVAGGGLVGIMDVFVGRMGALVADGLNVGGGTTIVLVPPGRGC
jgi:hypothetical protein